MNTVANGEKNGANNHTQRCKVPFLLMVSVSLNT